MIPTMDRPKLLRQLLQALLQQTCSPSEVVVVDDSKRLNHTATMLASLTSEFEARECKLKYAKVPHRGADAARNLGVQLCTGQVVLFLDDDVVLDNDLLRNLMSFLDEHPEALGVGAAIHEQAEKAGTGFGSLGIATRKALMLNYEEKDKYAVRRSGKGIFPKPLTKVIRAQWLGGCCCCFRKHVFDNLQFDTNLTGYDVCGDFEFSHRLYRMYPGSLYVIPQAKVIHTGSYYSGLRDPAQKLEIYRQLIFQSYVFFKLVYRSSLLNLVAFLWALNGNLLRTIAEQLLMKRTPLRLMHQIGAYVLLLRNLNAILVGDLRFLDQTD